MLRDGQRFNIKGVTVEIIEVMPYRRPRGKAYLVAYRIIDYDMVTPVAHFWIEDTETDEEKIREKLTEVVNHYKAVKSQLKRGMPTIPSPPSPPLHIEQL